MRTIPSRSWLRRAVASIILVGVVSASSCTRATPIVQSSSQASSLFNHQVMVQAGVPCLYCHAEATKSPAAGIPSMDKCMGCHRVIATDKPAIKALAGYWERQEPIQWPRLEQMPRFVYFSHRVHVGPAGLNCERCHGDVGHMGLAEPVVKMNMGWCLSCHKRQPNASQLQDCGVCHQ